MFYRDVLLDVLDKLCVLSFEIGAFKIRFLNVLKYAHAILNMKLL